jgi:putative sterol carrier protein
MNPTTDGQTRAERRVPGGQERVPIDLPALVGVSGRMRVDVKDDPAVTIHIDRGQVWTGDPEEQPDAVAVVEDRADFDRILAGELNPVVAAIQGRLVLQGDPELGTKVISALYAAKPFRAKQRAKEV